MTQLSEEYDLTVKVGVLTGMDLKRAQIIRHTGAEELDVRMAQLRLRRAAPHLEREDERPH